LTIDRVAIGWAAIDWAIGGAFERMFGLAAEQA